MRLLYFHRHEHTFAWVGESPLACEVIMECRRSSSHSIASPLTWSVCRFNPRPEFYDSLGTRSPRRGLHRQPVD